MYRLHWGHFAVVHVMILKDPFFFFKELTIIPSTIADFF